MQTWKYRAIADAESCGSTVLETSIAYLCRARTCRKIQIVNVIYAKRYYSAELSGEESVRGHVQAKASDEAKV